MPVYVDEFPRGGGYWGGGGHMFASDLDELHEMARRIGLRRAWFQQTSFAHYDLTRNKRQAALAAGAIDIGGDDDRIPDDVLMRDKQGRYTRRYGDIGGVHGT